MPSPKRQELIDLLTLQLFKKECLATISKYVDDESEAESLYDITAGELLTQNMEIVRDMKAFIKTAMRNKAMAYFKDKANRKETSANNFSERSTIDPVYSHMEFNEVRNAVNKYRSKSDFIVFEMVAGGFSYKQIADLIKEPIATEDAWRKRWCELRKWIKKYFNEK